MKQQFAPYSIFCKISDLQLTSLRFLSFASIMMLGFIMYYKALMPIDAPYAMQFSKNTISTKLFTLEDFLLAIPVFLSHYYGYSMQKAFYLFATFFSFSIAILSLLLCQNKSKADKNLFGETIALQAVAFCIFLSPIASKTFSFGSISHLTSIAMLPYIVSCNKKTPYDAIVIALSIFAFCINTFLLPIFAVCSMQKLQTMQKISIYQKCIAFACMLPLLYCCTQSTYIFVEHGLWDNLSLQANMLKFYFITCDLACRVKFFMSSVGVITIPLLLLNTKNFCFWILLSQSIWLIFYPAAPAGFQITMLMVSAISLFSIFGDYSKNSNKIYKPISIACAIVIFLLLFFMQCIPVIKGSIYREMGYIDFKNMVKESRGRSIYLMSARFKKFAPMPSAELIDRLHHAESQNIKVPKDVLLFLNQSVGYLMTHKPEIIIIEKKSYLKFLNRYKSFHKLYRYGAHIKMGDHLVAVYKTADFKN